MCLESFAVGWSLCVADMSPAHVRPVRGVCCSRAAVQPTLRADLSFPGGHVCTLSCITSAAPDRGPVSLASHQGVFGILLQQQRRRIIAQTP